MTSDPRDTVARLLEPLRENRAAFAEALHIASQAGGAITQRTRRFDTLSCRLASAGRGLSGAPLLLFHPHRRWARQPVRVALWSSTTLWRAFSTAA